LFERGVAARKEVEDAERELREANAALEQAQSASGAANALAGRTIVRAQFDGVVAKRFHNPGDLVEPGSSDPILRVIDPSASSDCRGTGRDAGANHGECAGAHRVPGGDEPIEASVIARPAAVDPGSVTAQFAFVPSAWPS
jgi:multidrug efflux pump subunit AcrA (membrane-fusion protein)